MAKMLHEVGGKSVSDFFIQSELIPLLKLWLVVFCILLPDKELWILLIIFIKI